VVAGQHRSFGVGDDRSIDTARTIEGGIGHNHKKPRARSPTPFSRSVVHSSLVGRKEKE
jgi:hypothetical protein